MNVRILRLELPEELGEQVDGFVLLEHVHEPLDVAHVEVLRLLLHGGWDASARCSQKLKVLCVYEHKLKFRL